MYVLHLFFAASCSFYDVDACYYIHLFKRVHSFMRQIRTLVRVTLKGIQQTRLKANARQASNVIFALG